MWAGGSVNGIATEWYKNGDIKSKIFFKNNTKVFVEDYKNGVVISHKTLNWIWITCYGSQAIITIPMRISHKIYCIIPVPIQTHRLTLHFIPTLILWFLPIAVLLPTN